VVFGVHDNTIGNIRRALVERVFMVDDGVGGLKPTPRPNPPGILTARLSRFRKELAHKSLQALPLTDQEFLDRYQGRKRQIYEKALESLRVRGVSSRDARIKMFVKAEKLNLTAKTDPAPRAIQPRDPRYGASVGKYIAHLEKVLFKSIDRVFGAKTVHKGMDNRVAGQAMETLWNDFKKPVAVGLDASRFDQHVSKEALEFEHSCWPLFVHGDKNKKACAKLLKMQLVNRGVAYARDGIAKYQVEGCRMSGDMNTSSGNCLLMCAMVWTYCQDHGITKFRLANNGDDCVVIIESNELRKLDNVGTWFLEMGFKMKVEKPVYELEQIEFCQTQPVRTVNGVVMTRNPKTCFAKDLTANCPINQRKVREAWYGCMRTGGLAISCGVPVHSSFYTMFPHSDVRLKGTEMEALLGSGLQRSARGLKDADNTITDQARYSYWLAFGILPDEQIALEQWFSGINLGEFLIEVDSPMAEPVLPLNDL
jgi:hypothetical protein